MSALVRKEARLLLPGFVAGLLLAFSIWWLPDNAGSQSGLSGILIVLAFMVCPVMLVVLTLSSFGRELSAGTFSFLLSQPVARLRVWRTKALLLATAVGLLWAAWWCSLSGNREFIGNEPEARRDAFVTTVLFVIAAYSGGLWTTLLFRQVTAAFWFTLLTPAALATVVSALHKRAQAAEATLAPALLMAFALYGIVGFVFARWLFLRAQDAHWTGGHIALPEVRGLAGWFARRGERRQWRPRAALWRKELQLHQSQFVLAGALTLMHLAMLAARTFGGEFEDSPGLQFVLEQFWVLWFAMPLLVGCAAVAEERRLGTLEGQLCLPARRRAQFAIKFVTAMLLSLFLGFVMPLLLEGARILPDFSDSSGNAASQYAVTTAAGEVIPIGSWVDMGRAALPGLLLSGIALSIGLVAYYASSLARNTMQALAPALVGILVVWFLILTAAHPDQVFRYPLWRGGLIYLLGTPPLLLALGGLTYGNCQRVLVGWPLWRRNALVLLAVLAGVAALTSATYHRVWEHFMTLEPPHGPARLPRSVRLSDESFNIAVQFPDGRNWASRLTLSTPDWAAMLTGDWKVAAVPGTSGYLDGTNWSSVARSHRDTLGIRSDGSLWVSERPEPLPTAGLFRPSPNSPMIRLGQDADWKAVTAYGSSAFLLKTNGTLWRLGTSRGSWKNWPGFAAFAPERLGSDSDWARVVRMQFGGLVFEKFDGRVWVWPSSTRAGFVDAEMIRLDADTSLERASYLDGQKSAASPWLGRQFRLGVGEDGSLRVIAYGGVVSQAGGLQRNWGLILQNISLGEETNWLALADNRHDVVALKTDGTLWHLDFPTDPVTKPEGFTARPLSRHSDWVALTGAMDGVVALAADGSLWFWAMEGRTYYPSAFTLQPLLAASRRPQLVGNVLGPTAR
jgi:ABC-type transport system involved in multi-copper enzyme maturation permease subunit